MLSFPLRRTNVITLWVWNMHECLELFKHWLKCKLDDVFWAAQCLRAYNRKCSQHGDRVLALALLRSRWARAGGQAVLWFHWDYQGHMQDTSPPLTGSVLTMGSDTCTPPPIWVWGVRMSPLLPSRQNSLSTKSMSSHTSRGSHLRLFHPCGHCVTMETGLLSCLYTHLKLLSHCGPIQSTIMSWICWKSFSSVSGICLPAHSKTYSCSTLVSFVKQLEIQCKLPSLAKDPKANSSDTILIFMNILSREITHASSCWVFSPRENSL